MKKCMFILVCVFCTIMAHTQPLMQSTINLHEDEFSFVVLLCSGEDFLAFEKDQPVIVENGGTIKDGPDMEEEQCKAVTISCSSRSVCDDFIIMFDEKKIKVLAGTRGDDFAKLLKDIKLRFYTDGKNRYINVLDSSKSRVLSSRKLTPIGVGMYTSTAIKQGKLSAKQINAFTAKPSLKGRESIVRSITERMTFTVMIRKGTKKL